MFIFLAPKNYRICGHFVQLQRSEYLVNAVRLTKGARQWENTHVNSSSVDQMAGLSPYCGPPRKVVSGEPCVGSDMALSQK